MAEKKWVIGFFFITINLKVELYFFTYNWFLGLFFCKTWANIFLKWRNSGKELDGFRNKNIEHES